MSTAVSERKPGSSQTGGLLLLGGAVVLPLAGVLVFDRARHALPRAESNLARAESALSEAHKREQLAQRNRVLLAAANDLQQHAQNLGVLPQGWGERQINLRQQHLMREEINRLLAPTARGNGQLLQAEEFELSVTKSDESLFEVPEISGQPVLMSLRGTTHFRISGKPL
jgi:hypothetical protein